MITARLRTLLCTNARPALHPADANKGLWPVPHETGMDSFSPLTCAAAQAEPTMSPRARL